MEEYHHIRQDYGKKALDESTVPASPFELFKSWFENALNSNILDANAMVLSTVKDNRPSSRIVLLKAIEDGSFVFFTNYKSKKAQEIAANENASLLFYWPQLEQQIRIEGRVTRVSASASDEYFYSRPLASQAGAIVSQQSEVLADKASLIKDMEALIQHKDSLQRPAHWGGFQLIADYFEFWQGRPSRLHDRLVYKKQNQGWKLERLYP